MQDMRQVREGGVQESVRDRRSTHSPHRMREMLRLKLCLSLVSLSCQLAKQLRDPWSSINGG